MDIRSKYSGGYSSRSSRVTAHSSGGSSSSISSTAREQVSRKKTPDVYSEVVSTAPNMRDTQYSQQRSASSHLSSQKAEHFFQRTMDKRIHDAANSASSSHSSLLHNLLELKSRGYQNAPGSNLTLSNKGGLPGGGKRVDTCQTVWSSSSANNYRRFTWDELQTKVYQIATEGVQLGNTINAMPPGPVNQQMTERFESLLNQRNEIRQELDRRARDHLH